MVVPPRLTSVIQEKISCTRMGDSPIDGSSRSSIRGRDISARPIASICCSPPDRVPATCLRRSLSRGKRVNTISRSSSIPFLEAAVRIYAPISRFSSTDMLANTRRPSGTCANPILTIRWGSVLVILVSINSTEPVRERSRPDTVCMAVVLPAPLAPMRETISPSPTSKDRPLRAWMAP